MRILHTSDWHLGRYLENISRLNEQREFIMELCEVAEREKVDIALVAGDVFDTSNPPAAAEELYYYALDRLSAGGRRAVVVIAGNHDNPERLCAAGPMAARNGVILLGYPASCPQAFTGEKGGVRLVDSGEGWMELSIEGCPHNAVIAALPFPSEARLEMVLSEESSEEKLQQAYSEKIGMRLEKLSEKFRDDTVNLVVSHMYLRGGFTSDSERVLQVGGAMTVDPEVLPEKAHFVALGHLHRPQQVKGSPCPAYYSGSPLAYSFSEVGYSKALYIVDAVPGRQAEIREININSGKALKKWVAARGIEEAVSWCREGRDPNCWIDLEIHTDRVLTAEEYRMLRELNPGIVSIRPLVKSEGEIVLNYENRENKRIDELFREFYRYRTGTEISEELLGLFLEVVNSDSGEEALPGGEDGEAKVS